MEVSLAAGGTVTVSSRSAISVATSAACCAGTPSVLWWYSRSPRSSRARCTGIFARFSRQIEPELLDDQAYSRRDREREESTQDAEELSSREQGQDDDGRRQAERFSVDPRDDDPAFELLVDDQEDQHDDRRGGSTRQRGQDRRARREEAADVRQNIGEPGEDGQGECIRHARNGEHREGETGDEDRREHLPAHVAADDDFEPEQNARETDVVVAGHEREEPSSEPIAVDEQVERKERGGDRASHHLRRSAANTKSRHACRSP